MRAADQWLHDIDNYLERQPLEKAELSIQTMATISIAHSLSYIEMHLERIAVAVNPYDDGTAS